MNSKKFKVKNSLLDIFFLTFGTLNFNDLRYLIYSKNQPLAIIECKSDKLKFDEAVDDLKYYAKKLNKKYFKIKFLIAVAGNKEDGVTVRNYFLHN